MARISKEYPSEDTARRAVTEQPQAGVTASHSDGNPQPVVPRTLFMNSSTRHDGGHE
jgi:hypothetical protein